MRGPPGVRVEPLSTYVVVRTNVWLVVPLLLAAVMVRV